jgi:hypothetical protein
VGLFLGTVGFAHQLTAVWTLACGGYNVDGYNGTSTEGYIRYLQLLSYRKLMIDSLLLLISSRYSFITARLRVVFTLHLVIHANSQSHFQGG